jgi:hypothetical protein
MRVMDIGRQSMYDTFGDKRALFLKALKMYVAQSVHSINVELERHGSALSAIRNALVTFAEQHYKIYWALLASCARECRRASYLFRCVSTRACGAGGACHLQ